MHVSLRRGLKHEYGSWNIKKESDMEREWAVTNAPAGVWRWHAREKRSPAAFFSRPQRRTSAARPANLFAIASGMERRGGRGGGGYGSAAYDSHLENENDAQTAKLLSQVSALKDVTSQINIHIKGDNDMLDKMNDSFDSTNNMLGGTMKRLNTLAASAGGGNIMYLAMFVIAVFLILWRMTR